MPTPIARASPPSPSAPPCSPAARSEGASTDCGLDQCTVTFDRGVEGSVSVLGVDAKFIGADGDQVTVEVAGEQLSLTVGQQAAEVGGLAVSVDSVTDTQVGFASRRA